MNDFSGLLPEHARRRRMSPKEVALSKNRYVWCDLAETIGFEKAHRLLCKLERRKGSLPTMSKRQQEEKEVAALKRREQIAQFVRDNPGCQKEDIFAALGINRNTFGNDVMTMRSKGMLHSVQKGARRYFYPGRAPERVPGK